MFLPRLQHCLSNPQTTLKKVKRNVEKDNILLKQMYLFVLTAVCVGFAGGLVGSTLAPWMKGAQALATKTAFREGFGQYALVEGAKAQLKKLRSQDTKNSFRNLKLNSCEPMERNLFPWVQSLPTSLKT